MHLLKLTTLAIFFILTSNLFSQNNKNEHIISNLLLSKNRDAIVINAAKHQRNINLLSSTSHSVIDSITTTTTYGKSNKYNFEYDSLGNLLFITFFSSTDSIWQPTNKVTYKYNSSNNITSYMKANWEDSIFVNTVHEVYIYNVKGALDSVFRYTYSDNTWNNFFRFRFEYSNEDLLTNSLLDFWYEGIWENVMLNKYTYNNKDLIEIYSESRDQVVDKITKQLLFLFGYDDNKNITSLLTKELIESKWKNSFNRSFIFDPNNNLVHESNDMWSDSIWFNTSVKDYHYNPNNKITSEITKNNTSESWKVSFNYNEKADLADANSAQLVDDTWTKADYMIAFSDSAKRNYSFFASDVNVYYNTITKVENKTAVVSDFSLSQNYPNPFNPTTTIKYSIPQSLKNNEYNTKLIVFDILGREVATLVNKQQKPCSYEVLFNANNLTSGIYFYRLQSGSFTQTKKLMLLK